MKTRFGVCVCAFVEGAGGWGGGWLHIFDGVAGGNGNDSFQNSKRDNLIKSIL